MTLKKGAPEHTVGDIKDVSVGINMKIIEHKREK